MAAYKTKDNWDDLSDDEDERTNVLAAQRAGASVAGPSTAGPSTAGPSASALVLGASASGPSPVAKNTAHKVPNRVPIIPNNNASLFKVPKKKKVKQVKPSADDEASDGGDDDCDAAYGDELNQMDKKMGNYVSFR